MPTVEELKELVWQKAQAELAELKGLAEELRGKCRGFAEKYGVSLADLQASLHVGAQAPPQDEGDSVRRVRAGRRRGRRRGRPRGRSLAVLREKVHQVVDAHRQSGEQFTTRSVREKLIAGGMEKSEADTARISLILTTQTDGLKVKKTHEGRRKINLFTARKVRAKKDS